MFGYDLARGNFLGIIQIGDVLIFLNRTFGIDLVEQWDSSISASMVLMIFFFLVAWVFSPKYGIISTMIRRADQHRRFNNQVVLAHVYHHQNTATEIEELTADSLYQHFRWSQSKIRRVLARLRASNLIRTANNVVQLTPHGEDHVKTFRQTNLASG